MKLIQLVQAWSLWNEGKAMDLVDSSLIKSCLPNEAFRCIQIGLLCVQDNPNSRPLICYQWCSCWRMKLQHFHFQNSLYFFHKGILKPRKEEKTLAAL